MRLLVPSIVALVGCASTDHELEDAGRLCAMSGEGLVPVGAMEFEPDKPIVLQVLAEVAGCPMDVEGTCTVHQIHPSLIFEVHSQITWNEGEVCAREVQYVGARCTVPAVRGYTLIVFAGDRLAIGVPSYTMETPCIGELFATDR